MKSQARLHFLQSCLVLFLFAVGWALGLAMTGLSGVAADALGICFIVVGGLLGLYVFLIYCVVSPIVRKVWKEWFLALSHTHYKEYEASYQTPVKHPLTETSLGHYGAQKENIALASVAHSSDDSPKHLSASGTQTPVPVMQVIPSEKSLTAEAPAVMKQSEEELVVHSDAADDSDSPDPNEETNL